MFHVDLVIAFRYALRRSRVRTDILLALLQTTRLSLPDLVRRTGADPRNVQCALLGDDRRYRRAHGLLTLELVEPTLAEGIEVYQLTPHGHAAAKMLQRDLARKVEARSAILV